ncbi:MAG: sensor histidine kinase, partial [Flavobacteriaceae bacterium]
DIGSVFMEEKEYPKAIEYLNQAYAIQLKNNYSDNMGLTLANLGEAYFRTGNYSRAEGYLIQGIAIAADSKKVMRELHHNLFELYQQQGSYKKALDNHKLYVAYNDSIIDEKSIESINALQVRYETTKKDEELARQQLQLKETENVLLKTENQNKLAIAGGLLLLFISIASLFYYRQRQRLKSQEITRLKAQQEVLKLEALIQGEEKERVRLAQDLHDGINGDLAVIKYKISSLDAEKFEKKQRSAYEEAIGMLDNAVEQIRRISHNLAPPALHNFELVEAIRQYCVKVASANPTLKINFQYFGEKLKLDKETETTVYRMVQELLTNVVKHAQATEALVQMNHRDDVLHITVEDNGKGFDIKSEATGIGMQNIRSRTHYLKGELDLDSGPNGTTIQIDLNLKNIQDK